MSLSNQFSLSTEGAHVTLLVLLSLSNPVALSTEGAHVTLLVLVSLSNQVALSTEGAVVSASAILSCGAIDTHKTKQQKKKRRRVRSGCTEHLFDVSRPLTSTCLWAQGTGAHVPLC